MLRRRRVADVSSQVWSKAELVGVISKEELTGVVVGDAMSYCGFADVLRMVFGRADK